MTAIEDRERQNEAMQDLLSPVFAAVREAGKRTLGQRHFDVQLIGGMVLHEGKLAEMTTGEGKTLVATLPAVLNALTGRGVHVVTVNDYLARRDSEWMGRIYNFLGLTVGVVVHGVTDQERKVAYAADIIYGQNNEFGFDYLRDNMKFNLNDYVQREHNFAIVDEVDSILIDEARTPLIISGASEESTDTYYIVDRAIPKLRKEEHYTIDEKLKTVALTEEGVTEAERVLGVENLYDPRNILVLHHVNQGLRAHTLYKRDVDYVVKEGEVIIVDEFTGRLMPGRRWSDGLHQAVEAKEGVKIESENQTLATITFQNYFRMYKKLAGMTGTADTESVEFREIYNLDVMVAPTNKPMIRIDHHDMIFKTEAEKFDAVIDEIVECSEKGQPVLVGTVSIEKSERVAEKLKKTGIKHHVLNAKNHESAKAGDRCAGGKIRRGDDLHQHGRARHRHRAGRQPGVHGGVGDPAPAIPKIRLSIPRWKKYKAQCAAEREQVLKAGGLHILGTERHESRRIDNQLRGRSGRQGDPGSSRFYISLEDDLLRIFGADRLKGLMGKMGMEDGVPIEHRWISKAIENAQKKVEAHNFDIRKHLLEYDDVMNKQREVVYHRRRELLSPEPLKEDVLEMCEATIEEIIAAHCDVEKDPDQWDWPEIENAFFKQFRFRPGLKEIAEKENVHQPDDLIDLALEPIKALYDAREAEFSPEVMRQIEKIVSLQTLDALWKDHLLAMDHLKEGIGLRGYAQQNPLVEYQKEGFTMFGSLMEVMQKDIVEKVFSVQVQKPQDVEEVQQQQAAAKPPRVTMSHGAEVQQSAPAQAKREPDRVGRNDPCPCGSGKKYKRCHGK